MKAEDIVLQSPDGSPLFIKLEDRYCAITPKIGMLVVIHTANTKHVGWISDIRETGLVLVSSLEITTKHPCMEDIKIPFKAITNIYLYEY